MYESNLARPRQQTIRSSVYADRAMQEVYDAAYATLHVRVSNKAACHLYKVTLGYECVPCPPCLESSPNPQTPVPQSDWHVSVAISQTETYRGRCSVLCGLVLCIMHRDVSICCFRIGINVLSLLRLPGITGCQKLCADAKGLHSTVSLTHPIAQTQCSHKIQQRAAQHCGFVSARGL